ncbi:MAG: trehalose-phosphatase [Phycisphaerae bacterium]|nr:trehalose-phosphatase [Phycisphaerae bacterium]
MSATRKDRLESIARAGVLLVASDFDGVLAPIVLRPADAVMSPRAGAALERLARLPRTYVGVISGRSLRDLKQRVNGHSGIWLTGSHGCEPEHGARVELNPEQQALLDYARAACEREAACTPGSTVELKPFAVAFHFRGCKPEHAGAALQRIDSALADKPGLYRMAGSMVVEFSVLQADKGNGLSVMRYRTGASATIFIGDDVTDESGFASLGNEDLSVKVGPGETRAIERVADQPAAIELLEHLAEQRAAYLRDSLPPGIEQHSILSDQRSIAVVDPRGSIVWLCLPRADSAAVFSRLMGDSTRGEFEITPAEPEDDPRQEYDSDTFTLKTCWRRFTVTDYFDCTGGRAYQRAGRSDLIRCIEGAGRVRIRFAPRLDFGRMPTTLVRQESGVEVDGSPDPFVLFSPGVAWSIEAEGQHQTAIAEFDLTNGPVTLELRYGFGSLHPVQVPEAERREQTSRFWSGWVRTLRLPSLRPDLVARSALAIKALCYGPSGAIYAAATTSLPEQLGGMRNWDYRYCWPRDACLAAAALIRLGNTGVAMKLLDWLVAVVDRCESADRLRPLYTVSGHELGQEGEIGELTGYGGSRPVRVGNAADRQVQLDVFGPIVGLVAMLVEKGAPVTPEHWKLVLSMVSAVRARWMEPDHGIWEVRGPRAHHVHTKIMCWHAVDRALDIARGVLGRDRPDWAELRKEIAADILANGWNDRAQAFTFRYGSDELDAAVLHIGLTGLLPPSDERFRATVLAIQAKLLDGPVVYRYRLDDGLPGTEGGFHICTSWLIESLALLGEREAARKLFEHMAALAGPTGLLPEQFDPCTGLSLGNMPQAYSHLGLINAAVRLGAA